MSRRGAHRTGRSASKCEVSTAKRPKPVGKRFASHEAGPSSMPFLPIRDLYSPREIALAAGVSEARRDAALARRRELVRARRSGPHRARGAASSRRRAESERPRPARGIFSIFSEAPPTIGSSVPLACRAPSMRGARGRCLFIAAFNLAPRAASLQLDEHPADRCAWSSWRRRVRAAAVAAAGCVQKAPPPKALREGRERLSSPLPRSAASRSRSCRCRHRRSRPSPTPPLEGGAAAGGRRADHYRAGRHAKPRRRLEETPVENESHGPGTGGGAGTGTGTGLGEGDGSGVGPGSGGGTGGGPYRPGSGIEPPRLLREVQARTTRRRRGSAGSPATSCSKSSCGATASVGDVKMLQGLAGRTERSRRAGRAAVAVLAGAAVRARRWT